MKNVNDEEKKRLRTHYLKLRKNMPSGERQPRDEAIFKNAAGFLDSLRASTVFSYVSVLGEVDTHRLIRRTLQNGGQVICPSPDIRALPEHGFCEVSGISEAGMPELVALNPDARIPIDAAIVPGVVWDRQGFRVGFGGGYFDRLLEKLGASLPRIGLSYECQLVDQVPRDPWDQAVHILITERQLIKTRPD